MTKLDFNPLVSVIIPFYKNKRWLIQALDSVQCQTYNNFEIILVNDGSSEILDDISYSNLIVINQPNLGAASARNNALVFAKGVYVAFLDSDDLWLPNKLELQVQYMIKNKYKWSHTDYSTFLQEDIDCLSNVICDFKSKIYPRILFHCPIATPCVMLERSILKDNKLFSFNEDIDVGEDTLFWIEIAKKYELGYLNSTLTCVRLRGANAAYNPILQLKYWANLSDYINDDYFFKSKDNIFYFFRAYLFICKYLYRIVDLIKESSLQRRIAFALYAFPYLCRKFICKFIS